MIPTDVDRLAGRGGPEVSLASSEMRAIAEQALAGVRGGTRVLAIVSDKTRDDNTDVLFPLVADVLDRKQIAQLDVLIAQGTHPPMADGQKRAKIGAGTAGLPGLGRLFDHQWDRDSQLVALGELSAHQMNALTGGLMPERLQVRANALVGPGVYDLILVFGQTVPHEVAGFAGGAKYFFPGVGGPEVTHMTHWLGALATIEQVIGRVETPTRHVIEAAARLIRTSVVSFTTVATRSAAGLRTHALFAGDLYATLRRAAAVSAQVHVKYAGRRYRRVVALLDPHYDELWVGGKASYKLGAIIEEGGELIIYAPHLREISSTHGALIEKYGYAPLERVREMVDGSDELRANLCVAAHLAHVSYASARTADGGVGPRYRITLASGVAEDACRRVNLDFLDHRAFRRDSYEADADTLIVEDAGRDLYLVAPEFDPRERRTDTIAGSSDQRS